MLDNSILVGSLTMFDIFVSYLSTFNIFQHLSTIFQHLSTIFQHLSTIFGMLNDPHQGKKQSDVMRFLARLRNWEHLGSAGGFTVSPFCGR